MLCNSFVRVLHWKRCKSRNNRGWDLVEYTVGVMHRYHLEYGEIKIELPASVASLVVRSTQFDEFLSDALYTLRRTYPNAPQIVSVNPYDPDEVTITAVGAESRKYRVSEYPLLENILPLGLEELENYALWRRGFLKWWNRCLKTG